MDQQRHFLLTARMPMSTCRMCVYVIPTDDLQILLTTARVYIEPANSPLCYYAVKTRLLYVIMRTI